MANQVVVPFPGLHDARAASRETRRSRIFARLSTARDVVMALVETLSYLGEARVRPPALPGREPPK